MKNIAVLIILLLPLLAYAGEGGVIRGVDEVVAEASSIYRVRIYSVDSDACGNKLTKYKGEIIEIFKGTLTPRTKVKFCGYPGLSNVENYLLAFQRLDDEMEVVYPDAVFIERLPDEYYRVLSYESNKYEVDGKKAMVLGFEQENLLDVIKSSLKSKD
jgi:hypothetical protein